MTLSIDTNTFQLGLAIVAMIQTIALAYVAVLSARTHGQVTSVHDIVSAPDAKTPGSAPSDPGVPKG